MNQVGTSSGLFDTAQSRRAQYSWAAQPWDARRTVLKRFREALAANPDQLLEATAMHRGVTELEALHSEIIPLAEVCRWLEGNAKSVLAPRTSGGYLSSWMGSRRIDISREPMGLVLIIAPGNYPLFIAATQSLQALTAGNAVLLKPAPGATQLLTRLRDALLVAGVPMDLLTLLPEDPGSVRDALFAAHGPDHVVVTGSARTGRALQQLIAESGRPVGLTAELSGADVCIILPGAKLLDVTCALRFSVNLNRGRTCIAPRLVLVPLDLESELVGHLQREFANLAAEPYSHEESRRFAHILSLATHLGAELVHIENSPVAILRHLPLDADFPWGDLFSPLLFLSTYRSLEEAIAIQRRMKQALGATVFGNLKQARAVAAQLDAGFVTINDLVAPAEDPRVPITARKASGQGVTRGAEGLLALTTAKAITTQRSWFHHHRGQATDKEEGNGGDLLRAMLAFKHAPLLHRVSALKGLLGAWVAHYQARHDSAQRGKR